MHAARREKQLGQHRVLRHGPEIAVSLVDPSLDRLPGYIAALEAGWSPNTTRDVSGEQLAAIRQDAGEFLRDLVEHENRIVTLADGSRVPGLPGRVFWIWDGAFCGAINLRFVPGKPGRAGRGIGAGGPPYPGTDVESAADGYRFRVSTPIAGTLIMVTRQRPASGIPRSRPGSPCRATIAAQRHHDKPGAEAGRFETITCIP